MGLPSRPRSTNLLQVALSCVVLVASLQRSLVQSQSTPAIPVINSDTPIDALLGLNFSKAFFNCNNGSSPTSWCGDANPYVVAQPVTFETPNITITNESLVPQTSSLPYPDPAGKFQEMVNSYHRAFECDGEEATSQCRMVSQLSYLDGVVQSVTPTTDQDFCSFTGSCATTPCNVTGCAYCHSSEFNCNTTCGGLWCPASAAPAPAPSPITTSRIFAMAVKQWDPNSQSIVEGAALYDAKLGLLTGAQTGGVSLEINFLLSLGDAATGFKWVVIALKPVGYVVVVIVFVGVVLRSSRSSL